MPARHTFESFTQKANEVHNGIYDYSEVDIRHPKVKIRCRLCGNDFYQRKCQHLSGKGCNACNRVNAAKLKVVTLDEWLVRFNNAHFGKQFDYSRVVIDGNKKITVGCPVHKWVQMTPHRHVNSKTGCPLCSIRCRGDSQKIRLEDFIVRANLVHGGRYDYAHSTLQDGVSGVVSIVCNDHGAFEQIGTDHLAGHGCKYCYSGGYRKERSGSFYVLQDRKNSIVKVGITNRPVNIRLSELNKSQYDFDLMFHVTLADGEVAWKLEKEMLGLMCANYRSCEARFDGSTECFHCSDTESVVESAVRICSNLLHNKSLPQ